MTDLLDRGFSATYFFCSSHCRFPAILSGLPSFSREIRHYSYQSPFICYSTFIPCCFQNFVFILVFCQFHYDMSCRRSIQVELEGSSLCLVDFKAFFLPRSGKFSTMISLSTPSAPFALSSSSGIPIMCILFLFSASLSSLIIPSYSWIFFISLFLSFLFFHNFIF